MLIPISTDTSIRRTPWANYALITINIVIFVICSMAQAVAESPDSLARQIWQLHEWGVLRGDAPNLYQFFTYQFLHANFAHIGGNMLFLWVFGNPVNAKMGQWPYLFFYLACGIFAATGYGMFNDHAMIGASGAIAGITTAYFALFPRSYITVFYWFFFIGTFELPSMFMIVIKMILWDNVFAPRWVAEAGSNVAFGAHLAGYVFGFVASTVMLLLGTLPRDQFDIVALWRRWFQRKMMQSAMSDPNARARAQFGRVARPISVKDVATATVVDPTEERITDLRRQIGEALSRNDRDTAAKLYEQLMEVDPRQILARQQQLDVANQLYTLNRLPQAAAAYEKFLSHYGFSPEADEVHLLLGIIYARDLHQYEVAEGHLKLLVEKPNNEKRREQCRHWLNVVHEALNRDKNE